MLTNERIQASEVRLLSQEGEQLGVMPLETALQEAKQKGLDLVLLNGSSNPAVCKLMNYGKFKFDSIKKEKELKKGQKVSEMKFMVIKKMTIDKHDMETKAKHVKRFLQDGDKVKVTLWMKRGREQAYTHIAMDVMNEFFAMVEEFGVLDKPPAKTGKDVMMIIIPKK